MKKTYRVLLFVAGLGLGLALTGCDGSPDLLTAILNQQLAEATENGDGDGLVPRGDDADSRLTIRILNRTGVTIELDVLIDGLPETISCSSTDVTSVSRQPGICDVPLLDCPQQVEAVEARRLDLFGGYLGGQRFNANPDFIFDQGVDYQCGQFLIFDFEEEDIDAFAL